jgi:hypothetical protein
MAVTNIRFERNICWAKFLYQKKILVLRCSWLQFNVKVPTSNVEGFSNVSANFSVAIFRPKVAATFPFACYIYWQTCWPPSDMPAVSSRLSMDNTNQAITSRQAAIGSALQEVGTVTAADPERAGSLTVTDWSVRWIWEEARAATRHSFSPWGPPQSRWELCTKHSSRILPNFLKVPFREKLAIEVKSILNMFMHNLAQRIKRRPYLTFLNFLRQPIQRIFPKFGTEVHRK